MLRRGRQYNGDGQVARGLLSTRTVPLTRSSFQFGTSSSTSPIRVTVHPFVQPHDETHVREYLAHSGPDHREKSGSERSCFEEEEKRSMQTLRRLQFFSCGIRSRYS